MNTSLLVTSCSIVNLTSTIKVILFLSYVCHLHHLHQKSAKNSAQLNHTVIKHIIANLSSADQSFLHQFHRQYSATSYFLFFSHCYLLLNCGGHSSSVPTLVVSRVAISPHEEARFNLGHHRVTRRTLRQSLLAYRKGDGWMDR